MTKIFAVNGISQRIPTNEYGDRAANVAPANVIPFSQLTQGEMQLHILDRELQILRDFYPELKREIDPLRTAITNALHAGIHRHGNSAAILFSRHNYLGKSIRQAISATKAANGGKRYVPKTGARVAAIGAQIVPLRDCTQFVVIQDDGYGNGSTTYLPGYDQCAAQAGFETAFNSRMQKSGPHLLYEFLDRSKHLNTAYDNGAKVTAASAGYIAGKQSLHRNAVSATAQIAKFDRTTLASWYNLSVRESNISKGLTPMDGFDTINLLKAGEVVKKRPECNIRKVQINGVGIAIAVLIPLIVKLIGALTAAIAATAGLIGILKQDPRQGQLASLGTYDFSADTLDWDGDGIPNNQDPTPGNDPAGQNNMLLIGAAAAGLYFLTQD